MLHIHKYSILKEAVHFKIQPLQVAKIGIIANNYFTMMRFIYHNYKTT